MSASIKAATTATRKNIRGTKDYRIYFINFNLPSVPDLSAIRIHGRPIRVVNHGTAKAERAFGKLMAAFKDNSFCGDVGSYAAEILREEHGHPDFAVYLQSKKGKEGKESKEMLGAAICMQVWHEDYTNSDYPRDPESLYIEVLCGSKKIKGAGSVLTDALNAIAVELGRSYLALQATHDSLPFYMHMGFECDTDKKCVKPVEVVSFGGGAAAVGGGKRKTRRSRHRGI
jgi:hypothetical protein